MHISDPEEVETVLAFFRRHLAREWDVPLSLFDGLVQRYRLLVAVVDGAISRVLLVGSREQHRLELQLNHYSFATVAPDKKKLEIGRLWGGNSTLRFTASEISK